MTDEKPKCPNCQTHLLVSVFGTICGNCFWEPGDDMEKNDEN
jgi:hypothetical protein